MRKNDWTTLPLLSPKLGKIRGLIDSASAVTGTTGGIASEYFTAAVDQIPPNFLSIAENCFVDQANALRRRPGAIGKFTDTVADPVYLPMVINGYCFYMKGATIYYESDSTTVQTLSGGSPGLENCSWTSHGNSIYDSHLVFTSTTHASPLVLEGDSGTHAVTAINIDAGVFPTGSGRLVCSAYSRLFIAGGSDSSNWNLITWSDPQAALNGTAAQNFPPDNFAYCGSPRSRLHQLTACCAVGDFIYWFTTSSIWRQSIIDPHDIIELYQGIGAAGPQCVTVDNGIVYFIGNNDIYRWFPSGGAPKSLTVTDDGFSVLTRLRGGDVDGTSSIGWDSVNGLLFCTINSSFTVVWNQFNNGFYIWDFAAKGWAFKKGTPESADQVTYFADSNANQVRYLYHGAYSDFPSTTDYTNQTNAEPFTTIIQTRHFGIDDAWVRLKNITLSLIPVDLGGDLDVEIIGSTDSVLVTKTIPLTTGAQYGSAVYGSSQYASLTFYKKLIGFEYPDARLLAIKITKSDNYPLRINSLDALVCASHKHRHTYI